MNREAHVSSASNYRLSSGVKYRKEKEVKTFELREKVGSHGNPDAAITWKVSRGSVKSKSSAHFALNLSKISKEEDNYRLNRKLSGKRIIAVSTQSE